MVNEFKQKKYQSVEEVPVWMMSHHAALNVYKLTANFPKTEVYGLTSQLRRAATSIPANITEGFYRHSTKELIQFLFNARASCGETSYHLQLAKDLRYTSLDDYIALRGKYDEISKQLIRWIQTLQKKLK